MSEERLAEPMPEISFELSAEILSRTMVGQGLVIEARRARASEIHLRAEVERLTAANNHWEAEYQDDRERGYK